MSCIEIRPLLALKTLAALEPDEDARVGDHLASCASCRAETGALESAVASVKAAEGAPARAGAREEIWSKVSAELDRRGDQPAPAALPIALACCFCHGTLARAEACYCASCLAPHHDECWKSHGRCSAPGCDETRVVRPEQNVRVAMPRRTKWLLAFAALAVGSTAGVAALNQRADPARELLEQAERPAPETKSVDSGPSIAVQAEDLDLRDAVAQVASRSGRGILVDATVNEKVTLSARSIHWRDAVDVLAHMSKCDVEPIGEETLLLTQPPRVTIQFTSANARVVLQLLAAYSGKNIVISPRCSLTEMSVDFREENWYSALRAMLKIYNVHAVVQGDVIVVLPGPGADLPDSGGVGPSRWPFPDPAGEPRTRMDVDFEDVDLRAACEQIGRKVGVNILVDPGVNERVSLGMQGAPWRDVVLVLARTTQCKLEKRGAVIVLSQPPKVTLQASETPADVWFQLLAGYARRNVIVAPEVKGTVTCDLKEVDWLDAMQATALATGYEVVDVHGILTVRSPREGGK